MGNRKLNPLCVYGHLRRWSEKAGRYICDECNARNYAAWAAVKRPRKRVIPTISTGSAK